MAAPNTAPTNTAALTPAGRSLEGTGASVLVGLDVGVVVAWEVGVETEVANVDDCEVCGFCCISDVEAAFEPDAAFPAPPWMVNGLREDAMLPSASMPSRVHLLPVARESGTQV